MSRIGNQPINIPKGVDVLISGPEVAVKGPKGELKTRFDPDIAIKNEDGVLRVARTSDQGRYRALHGLTRSLLANMVIGVSEGYRRQLDLVGVGYRAQQEGAGAQDTEATQPIGFTTGA